MYIYIFMYTYIIYKCTHSVKFAESWFKPSLNDNYMYCIIIKITRKNQYTLSLKYSL